MDRFLKRAHRVLENDVEGMYMKETPSIAINCILESFFLRNTRIITPTNSNKNPSFRTIVFYLPDSLLIVRPVEEKVRHFLFLCVQY